jgi:hypothetical protein
MNTRYKNEVRTVIQNDKVIGYIARRETLHGTSMEIPNTWSATRCLKNPDWHEGFFTRKEARKFLDQLPYLDVNVVD